MKLYQNYIIKNLAIPALVITLTLTGIVWLTQSLRFIDMIVNRGLGITTFLYISSLLIPSFLLIIMPIALFCSVIFVFNRLIMESELLVFKSAGLSRVDLALPALFIAIIATIISYLISFYILPASYREFKDTQAFVRDNYTSVLLQEGVFNSLTSGLTVYVDERSGNDVLKGILVHDSRNPSKAVTLMAEQGKLIRSTTGPRFDLINGNRQEIDNKSGNLSVLYFDRYDMDISVYTKRDGSRFREAEERYMHELLNPGEVSEKTKHKFIAEAHNRILWPLYNISFVLIATAILLTGQLNRRGMWKRIVLSTIVAAATALSNVLFKNAIAATPSLTPVFYLSVFIVPIFCYHLLTSDKVSFELSFQGFTNKNKAFKL